ncbi:hypothetical protein ACQPZG_09235 [Streptomyces sp. CA-294286]|uniref:hypothetical protein n=1 Tax=Streptomyces sp. CA-294286 TaxID=3240070 RepID=UPI003D94437E
MDIFAMFRRKPKESAEAPTGEEQTPAPDADATAEPVTAEPKTAEADDEADAKAATETAASSEPAATEDAEIPGQPSAAKAADNEVGETART